MITMVVSVRVSCAAEKMAVVGRIAVCFFLNSNINSFEAFESADDDPEFEKAFY